MNLPSRNKLLALGAAGALALSLTGIALAQDPASDAEPGREERVGLVRFHGILFGLHQVVEVSGLDGSVFRVGIKDGLSVNEVLEANGLDPAAVKAEVLANLEERLAEKVAAGEIDHARADEILTNADAKLTRLMAATPDSDRLPLPVIRHAAVHGLFASAAETIGITAEELLSEMRDSGATIAEVATARGIDPQAVIDAAVARALAKIDELEGEGKITPERAGELRANTPGRVARFVNERAPRDGDRTE